MIRETGRWVFGVSSGQMIKTLGSEIKRYRRGFGRRDGIVN